MPDWGWSNNSKVNLLEALTSLKKQIENPSPVPDFRYVQVKWKGEWRLGLWPEHKMDEYWVQYRKWRDEE